MNTHFHPTPPRGAVLVVGLVLLLILTVIGVSALQTTALQERMTGNLRQGNVAFQAAEGALQAALTYIANQPAPLSAAADGGTAAVWTPCTVSSDTATCTRLPGVINDWLSNRAASTAGYAYASLPSMNNEDFANVTAQPRVYIEQRWLAPPDFDAASRGGGTWFYTVTAVGFGETPNAVAVLQSTVARWYR